MKARRIACTSISGNPTLSQPEDRAAAFARILPEGYRAEDEAVFGEPWEAAAFALAVHLHERGTFSWPEWSAVLAEEIAAGPERPYFESWLAALETLFTSKTGVARESLASLRDAWDRAYRRTPHGRPVVLDENA